MKVDIWSDVVCPWCYIGKRRFETAFARFAHADSTEVTWHSYQLNPDAPSEGAAPLLESFCEHHGMTPEQATEMHDHVTEVAATEGLTYRFDIAQRGNTFAAHRLIHHAASKGLADAMEERLFAAYFEQGANINDLEALTALAVEVGLDADDVRLVLDSDAYASDVRADITQAAAYGINGVPFFVIDGKFGISGAQGPDGILQTLDHAWAQANPLVMATGAGESVCGPDGCAIP